MNNNFYYVECRAAASGRYSKGYDNINTDTQHISGTALIPTKALRVHGALLLTSRFCIREPAAQPRSTIGTEKNKVVLNIQSD